MVTIPYNEFCRPMFRMIAAAIQATSPWGVDTAGGVETAPGIKDSVRVRAFVSAARHGQDRGEPTDL